jgi:hypothetical protein
VVLRNDCLCLVQRREPPLDLEIFISGDAHHDPPFLDEQFELIRQLF